MYTLEEQTAGLAQFTPIDPTIHETVDTSSEQSAWVAQYLDWYQIENPLQPIDPFPSMAQRI